MSQAIVTESKLVAIADAIRSVGSLSGSMTLDQMASAILSLSGGGGGGGGDIDAFIQGTLSEINTNASYVRSYCFISLYTLESFIGNNVSLVDFSAFQSCTSLKYVSIPNATRLESNAFFGCTQLSDIYFTSKLKTIMGDAFRNCPIESFDGTYISGAADYAFHFAFKSGISLSFPNLSYLRNGVFSEAKMSYISLPIASQTGQHPFMSCSYLRELELPAMPSLTSGCCLYCTSLTTVSLPILSRMSIGAFESCTALTSVYIPSCRYLYNYVFQGCTALSEISLPMVEYMSTSVFQGCTNLRRIKFTSQNTNWAIFAGAAIFKDCQKLSIVDLTSLSMITPLGFVDTFFNTPMSNSSYLGYYGSIYVPASLYNTYITSTNWATYSARITSDPVPA